MNYKTTKINLNKGINRWKSILVYICCPGESDDEQYEAKLDYEQEGLGFCVHAYHKFHLHFICTYVVYVISISNYLVIKLLLQIYN